MDLQNFNNSLSAAQPPSGLSVQLKSLWYDGKGDWTTAHDLIDHLSDRSSAHIHAYLHRKEGDLWNADYWYRRADQARPDISVEEEWAELVKFYLK